MKNKTLLFILLILTGCSINPATDAENSEDASTISSTEQQRDSTFILEAVQGYVKLNDYTTPHTYIVDTDRNEVYVDVYEEISGITVEEIIENADKAGEELTEPIYEIEAFEFEDDSFRFQYDSKMVEFTALSETYYEDQDGVRYTIDSHSGIDDYIESFFE